LYAHWESSSSAHNHPFSIHFRFISAAAHSLASAPHVTGPLLLLNALAQAQALQRAHWGLATKVHLVDQLAQALVIDVSGQQLM
jgi:hypothetical protein